MLPESFIVWKWKPHPGYRSRFESRHVNTVRAMIAKYYPHPHRFICVTDDPAGLDSGIETIPLWEQYATLLNPWGHPRNPSCYRRLRSFHPEIGTLFGARFVSLDLDTVLTADITPLVDRPEDFVIWGDTQRWTLYNASMYLLTAGARPQVWEQFDPVRSPQVAKAAKQYGSDQGWISVCLGPGEATWRQADGVYSWRNDLREQARLPANARAVMFHGHVDPWSPICARVPWIREWYQ